METNVEVPHAWNSTVFFRPENYVALERGYSKNEVGLSWHRTDGFGSVLEFLYDICNDVILL